uniref:Uncharacterized protein LOC111103758 isoform X2 n=1 Tax=Crassostrea virginica TaxID=6565 RepID=A0A8B8APG7_CRAVI|nr:uncharacterized protein LOC111103758 isoform X2 [Crassostrea virginica]
MTTNMTLLIIILFMPNTEGQMYSLFTVNSRFSGFHLEKISPMGMEICVKECAKRVSCASLNFHRGRLECELSHSDATANPEGMTSNSEYIYIDRSHIPQKYFDACSASCSTNRCCVATATGPKCVKSECPAHHPDANFTNVKVTSTSIGTTLSYTCFLDQSITLTSTCKADGTWTSSASSCPQYNPPDCFESNTSCWFQFNFTHDNSYNGCPGGTRYVRKTQYSSAPYVGVVLCTATRYKILLGSDVLGPFLNIGDGSGSGADHCELVGGYQLGAVMANDYINSPSVTGYQRLHWDEEFSLGAIGFSTTSYHYNSWYECGVSIPEASQPACFNDISSCWYEYKFAHDNTWNGCTGGRKYKIFLGANLTGTFLNVGDGNGQGEDFCELVGGLEMNANLPGDYTNAPLMTGYARRNWGEEFQLQPIAGGTTWHCNSWYECGVQIPGTPEPDCMSATPPCWYSYNVWLDNSFNGCSGGQIFVKRTNYTSAPFLAVQLCSSTIYKLFLGSSLGGKFMNIADGSGRGEDHCELVGGSELSASTGMSNHPYQYFYGYYRHDVGEQFRLELSSAFPNSYGCGVSIPGTDIVV